MNNFPTMPIRAQYADKSASGKELDDAVVVEDGEVTIDKLIVGEADAHKVVSDEANIDELTADEVSINRLSGGDITGDSIIENMSGYDYETATIASTTLVYNYIGAVKNGNKLTIVVDGKLTPTSSTPYNVNLGWFKMPSDVIAKLVPTDGVVAFGTIGFYTATGSSAPKQIGTQYYKSGTEAVLIQLMSVSPLAGVLTADTTYRFRIEQTFLLSENLAA